MEARAASIRDEAAPECVWLLEHPPLYTAGTSADAADLLNARFPVHIAGRGGEYTYHGPGQRIAYAMLDLKARGPESGERGGPVSGCAVPILERLRARIRSQRWASGCGDG